MISLTHHVSGPELGTALADDLEEFALALSTLGEYAQRRRGFKDELFDGIETLNDDELTNVRYLAQMLTDLCKER